MLILPFVKISKNDAARAGGKGASLGEEAHAGIPVPPGVVILASRFERFLKEYAIHEQIDVELHTVNVSSMHTVDAASGVKIGKLYQVNRVMQGNAVEKEKYRVIGSLDGML